MRNNLSHIIRTRRGSYFKEGGWDFGLPPLVDCGLTSFQAIVDNLVHLDQFCRKNRIKLYILEVPRKEIIYKEFIVDNYGFDEKQFVKVSRAEETIRREVRKHHIPWVYPYEAFRDAARQDFVFLKCSNHWTDWGAFVGYCELMKEINKDFPDMPIVSLNDCRKSQNWLYRDGYRRDYGPPKHLSQFYNFSSSELTSPTDQVLYNYYDHKNGKNMVIEFGKFTKEFTYPEGKHKIMLTGTSQNENFLQFLPYSAARTRYIRLNFGQVKNEDEFKILKLYKKDIFSFKPEILILCIHTDNLPKLRDLCSPK